MVPPHGPAVACPSVSVLCHPRDSLFPGRKGTHGCQGSPTDGEERPERCRSAGRACRGRLERLVRTRRPDFHRRERRERRESSHGHEGHETDRVWDNRLLYSSSLRSWRSLRSISHLFVPAMGQCHRFRVRLPANRAATLFPRLGGRSEDQFAEEGELDADVVAEQDELVPAGRKPDLLLAQRLLRSPPAGAGIPGGGQLPL